MRIVIDGYNLLKAIPECRNLEAIDPHAARDDLIARLGRYRWLKKHQLTVVFDGWLTGQPLPRRMDVRGVQVIYSQRGERADDVIARVAPQVAHQGIVVTSDRILARHVQGLGVDVITAAEFEKRLRKALSGTGKAEGDQTGEACATQGRAAKKRRPSRRPSRAERARLRRWHNL